MDKTLAEVDKEKNKHALDVAVAAAARIEDAIAVAKDAAKILILTNVACSCYAGKSTEKCAAVKIQITF